MIKYLFTATLIILVLITGEKLMSDYSLEKDYEILLVKLTSGENLISYIDTQDPDKIELYRPIEIRLITDGPSTMHILTEWMPFTETETFLVDKRHVVMLQLPLIEVQKSYVQSAYSNYSSEEHNFYSDQDEDEEGEDKHIEPELKGNNRKIFEAMLELASNNSIKIQ